MQPQPTANPAVALYARVSTDEQTDRGTIQGQIDFLRRYSALHQLPIAGEYIDDGISGATPIASRPEGRRLLADGRTGRFGAVLVYRIDRLARTLSTLLQAHDALAWAGIDIRSATEPIDTTTPVGRLLFQLLGSFAEFERSSITERTTLGRDRNARAGKFVSGIVPYGYAR